MSDTGTSAAMSSSAVKGERSVGSRQAPTGSSSCTLESRSLVDAYSYRLGEEDGTYLGKEGTPVAVRARILPVEVVFEEAHGACIGVEFKTGSESMYSTAVDAVMKIR